MPRASSWRRIPRASGPAGARCQIRKKSRRLKELHYCTPESPRGESNLGYTANGQIIVENSPSHQRFGLVPSHAGDVSAQRRDQTAPGAPVGLRPRWTDLAYPSWWSTSEWATVREVARSQTAGSVETSRPGCAGLNILGRAIATVSNRDVKSRDTVHSERPCQDDKTAEYSLSLTDMAARVFLSHSSLDKEFARKLARDLRSHGLAVWVDEAELKTGDSIIEAIAASLPAVDHVAVVLSPNSVSSRWVQKELSLAVSLEIRGQIASVVPILYRPCELPQLLQDKLYADFTHPSDYAGALGRLIKALQYVSAPPRWGMPSDLEVLDDKVIRTGSSELTHVVDKRSGQRWLLKRTKRSASSFSILTAQRMRQTVQAAQVPVNSWAEAEYDYELLEYLDGWSLEELVRINHGGVFGELLTQWTRKLLQVLVQLQSNQPPVIHRDFRPSNIMVRREDLELVLVDFSSALLFDPLKTVDPLGSPSFVAPEVINGHPAPASDVYAAGCTVYSMNTGEDPPTVLQREHFGRSMVLCHEEDEVSCVFPRMTLLDPEERFTTAREALAKMKRPDWTLTYHRFRDFRLPDGRVIQQGGWF